MVIMLDVDRVSFITRHRIRQEFKLQAVGIC